MSRPSTITALPQQSAQAPAGAGAHWLLPSAAPVLRQGLCALAQPCLAQAQHTPRFLFHDATVLLVAAGRLDVDAGVSQLSVDAPTSLLLIEPGTCADLQKTPGGAEQRFRSVFLTLSSTLLEAFHQAHQQTHGARTQNSSQPVPYQQPLLDDELASTFRRVVDSVNIQRVSDARLQHRLMDFLLLLAERGHGFQDARQRGTAGRLRTLMGEAPEQRWTAHAAGQALAMSEATLRRRLAGEGVRFEHLLADIRMHHAMMLLQTTAWSIPRIAQACGYQSRARFAERFRTRFGYLPSAVR
ncbi:helix-turn-helix transcriptional regulator [Comamonas sp. GB3 AK4-5]|uniref:helix-turn-helix transcriptional regulator n=1 Tax=Comamonas sp. GB3 AK4-5 TaxID=3231487 RepID=UPI00351ED555